MDIVFDYDRLLLRDYITLSNLVSSGDVGINTIFAILTVIDKLTDNPIAIGALADGAGNDIINKFAAGLSKYIDSLGYKPAGAP